MNTHDHKACDAAQGRTVNTAAIVELLTADLPYISSKYHVRSLSLFGSTARGEQREGSDVDLLVDFSDGADLLDLVGLADYLEQRVGRKVDVATPRSLREEFRETVASEAIRI